MKFKIFLVRSRSSIKKSGMEELEASVNEWLTDHPDITIENAHSLGGPNVGWDLAALAVWYTES